MEINKNTNFTGAFILKPKNIKTKESIPDIINKGRQIFYDIKYKGDVVIVTKDNYDTKVRDFIEASKVKFEYYPEISTKSGLDDQIPSKLVYLLNIKNNCVINNLKKLNKFLQPKNHLSKQCEYLKETTNTLRLNIENPQIDINDKGIFVIRDEAKKRTIKSTGFKGGSALVHVIPDSPVYESKRYLVYKNGKAIAKEYNTPEEILDFLKRFKKSMETT